MSIKVSVRVSVLDQCVHVKKKTKNQANIAFTLTVLSIDMLSIHNRMANKIAHKHGYLFLKENTLCPYFYWLQELILSCSLSLMSHTATLYCAAEGKERKLQRSK